MFDAPGKVALLLRLARKLPKCGIDEGVLNVRGTRQRSVGFGKLLDDNA